ncbi:MAG: caspase family protein [Pseudomonadota bacterium]
MPRSFTFPRLLKVLMASTVLTPGVAVAQNGMELERLLSNVPGFQASRAIDVETRASKRYAVVIGNSTYTAIPSLPNAHSDANVMSDFFKQQGYDVHTHLDITKRGFEDTLRRILFDVDKDTEVVIFFAGHGFQIGSENYLVPVDADLDSIYDVPFEAVSLGSLVGIVGARARLQVVILDSCRDNPFAGKAAVTRIGNELREARTGFSSQAAPLNSMMIFSTSPGSVAFDGDGDNSPFTAALIEEATETPDALIKDVFEGVRRLVYQKTNGRQVPWDSSTLVEPASFGLGNAITKPILTSSIGQGITRGLARIVTVDTSTPAQATPIADATATLEVDFVPEVEIGPALEDGLSISDTDVVRIDKQPETGRLVLADETGFQRNVEGETLTGADIRRLVLANQSVQVPAASLKNGLLQDRIEITVNGAQQVVGLSLKPDACDFEAGDHLDPDGMGLTRYANELRPELALAACEASLEREPENARFHFQKARALTALRQYDRAGEALERAKELGHTRAWQALGNHYYNEVKRSGGRTTQKASEEVLKLYAQGVDRGDPYAFYSLGRQFMRHGETNEIEIEGYDLMMRSLEVGHTFAMNELGYFYLNEESEFYDAERGLRYLRESAARDDIYGYNNMGLVYLRGMGGTPVDNAAAFDMFQKAADGGHPKGPYNLARMYRDGLVSGQPDLVSAVEWFSRGLERGDASSGGNASYLIAINEIDGFDMTDAAVLGAKAAALVSQGQVAQQSRDLITSYTEEALHSGTRRLMRDLGSDIQPGLDFDASAAAEYERLVTELGATPDAQTPVDRIIQLAGLVWQASPFRVDLY